MDYSNYAHQELVKELERLKRSEERYERLYNNVRIGLGCSRISDGKILEANSSLALAFGYGDVEEFIAEFKFFEQYVNPDVREKIAAELLSNGEVNNCEVEFYRKDGSKFWAITWIRCFPQEDFNEFLGMDITKQKRTTQALKASEKRFRELAEMLPEIVYEIDRKGRVTFANNAVLEIMGYAPEDMDKFTSFLEVLVPEDQDKAIEKMDKIMRGETSLSRAEYTAQRKDGSRFAVLSDSSPIMENGETVGLRGIFFDITERKQSENQLAKYRAQLERLVEMRTAELSIANRDLEQQIARRKQIEEELAAQGDKLNAVLQNIGEGVLTIDMKHRIVLTNPMARAYLSILSGTEWEDEKLSYLGGRMLRELLDVPPEGKVCHEVITKSPTRHVFEVVAHPLEGDSQKIGWVLILRDVTREREIRARNESQGRLAAVGQLAAGIAHDFNNILFGIMGYAQLLQRAPEMTGASLERLEKIYESGEHAANLIRQILDFSRKSPSHQKPQSLASVTKIAMDLLERTLPEHIETTLKIDPGEYFIMANQTQFLQMVTNLAVNARDAMPNGGKLTLKLSRLNITSSQKRPLHSMPKGEWIVLKVSDTGEGIPSEVLPHIFEPFFTTKHPTEGTGLGLAQVYGIVKQHLGFLDVETNESEGTTFVLYFPMLEKKPEARAEQSSETLKPGHGEMILLVDDEEIVLESGKEMLEALGYQVLTARNGQEALAIFDKRRDEVVLIITDMIMPVMGGVAMLNALMEQKESIKVLVLTGYPLENNWQESFSDNVVAWISKPLHISELSESIQKALY